SRAAEPDLRRATAAAEELTRKHPEAPHYWRTLAVNHSNLGDLLHTNGQPADSQAEYAKALAIADDLASRQPDILDYRYLRTLYQSSVAFMHRVTNQTAEADAAYERVIADLETQVQQFPRVPHPRQSLAMACMHRAAVLRMRKRPQDAERLLER